MSQITTVEIPGCPPLRAITTDIRGLVNVVEVSASPAGVAKVETWGEPDASRAILAASLADRSVDPILAVARRNGMIELLNPRNGETLALHQADGADQNDPVVALHLFKTYAPDFMLGTFLSCTDKGKASVRSVPNENVTSSSDIVPSSTSDWYVCDTGKVLFGSLDGGEYYAMFGGKDMDVNLWDVSYCRKIWSAEPPQADFRTRFTKPPKPWFTAGTFLHKDDHRKIVACTHNHQVRLYDIASDRAPTISIDFREAPITAVVQDLDGRTVHIGTETGDIASFDMRKAGTLLGCYAGECTTSIRSIVKHPELPIIASCGLDKYLRIWDTNRRQPLPKVSLKNHLTAVVIDSLFSAEESMETKSNQPDPSTIAEAAVRREKKIFVDSDEEGTRAVDGGGSDAEAFARKEKKKKKKKMVGEDGPN